MYVCFVNYIIATAFVCEREKLCSRGYIHNQLATVQEAVAAYLTLLVTSGNMT